MCHNDDHACYLGDCAWAGTPNCGGCLDSDCPSSDHQSAAELAQEHWAEANVAW